jgi:hypothetical protein
VVCKKPVSGAYERTNESYITPKHAPQLSQYPARSDGGLPTDCIFWVPADGPCWCSAVVVCKKLIVGAYQRPKQSDITQKHAPQLSKYLARSDGGSPADAPCWCAAVVVCRILCGAYERPKHSDITHTNAPQLSQYPARSDGGSPADAPCWCAAVVVCKKLVGGAYERPKESYITPKDAPQLS